MNSGFKVYHLIIIFILSILIVIGFNLLSKYINYKKTYEPFEKIEETNSKIIINGNYLTYINIGDKYKELGATAYINNEEIDDVLITYYKNDEQVFKIDTRFVGEYIVKYNLNNTTATRVVIVCNK